MKIDPRIDSIHDILTPFEGDLIIPGTYCVFANDIEQFRNIDGCSFGYYKGFKGSLAPSLFVYERTVDHETCSAKFCLPYEWVQKQKVNEGGGNRLRVETVSHRYEGLFDEALERFVATHDCVNVNIVRYDQSQGYKAIIVYRKAIQGEKL